MTSVSQYTSATVTVPTCNAWANIILGNGDNSSVINDGYGITASSWILSGLHGISFEDPTQYGGGAYVTLFTPELRSDSTDCVHFIECDRRMDNARVWPDSSGPLAGISAGTRVRTWAMNPTHGFRNLGLGTGTNSGPNIGIGTVDVGTGTVGNQDENGNGSDPTDPPDQGVRTGEGPGSGPGTNQDFEYGTVVMNVASFCFSKDTEIHNRTGGTYDTVPGAAGYGKVGETYGSAAMNIADKRKAVAYGTIVIPGVQSTSSRVFPYFENSFGVAGISAGNNAIFDVYFNGTMKNDLYCVVLSSETEQVYDGTIDPTDSGDTPSSGEFSMLAVRAGANGNLKTLTNFRIEQYKRDTTNGFWGVAPIVAKSGRTERIHFMVFGETSSGQSWLTNPNPVTSFGSIGPLDFNVWGASFYENTMSQVSAYPSLVPFPSLWASNSTVAPNYGGNNIRPEIGWTEYSSEGSILPWVTSVNEIPQGRRILFPSFYMMSMPPGIYEAANLNWDGVTERTVQYYNRYDGYTFTSPVHPTGITNYAFNEGGITYYGATFAGTRRMMSLYADHHAGIISSSLEEMLTKFDNEGCKFDYLVDDSESYYPFSLYYLTVGSLKGTTFGRQLVTNQHCNGATVEMLYDYFGISAAGSCGAKINALDPETIRAFAYDPRNLTYKYSTSGVTTDSSPTVAERFMELYGNMCSYYGITGITATSFTGAVEMLYEAGKSAGWAPFPSWQTDYAPYQAGRTANNFSSQYIFVAFSQIIYELYHGHYRTIAYKPALNRGLTYSQYEAAGVSFEDDIFAADANLNPISRITPTNNKAVASPTFYGNSIGGRAYTGHLISNAGYFPNPTNDVQKYYYNGLTYTTGRPYSRFEKIEDGCLRFYPKTALGGPNGVLYGSTGATSSNTPAIGATIASTPSGTTVEVWGGFTADPGNYIWFRKHGSTAYTKPYIIAAGLTANASEKKTLTVFESFAGSGIVAGQTFDIETVGSNGGFLQFVHDLQHLRAILRGNPNIATKGIMPWYAYSTFGNYTEDKRYWWEFAYHLLISGTTNMLFFSPASEETNKLLVNWRNISGNSRSIPVVKSKFLLNSKVFTSGGVLKDGANKGLYIWRITVRPGPLNETVTLVQNRRQDIPRTLTIPGGNFQDHSVSDSSTGTRGVWLITTSPTLPDYSIQE